MMKDKENKYVSLPDTVLHQLNEYSMGFILAYVDQVGAINIATQADSEAFFLGMQSKLSSWIKAHNMVARDMNANEIMGDGCGDPDCENCNPPEEED